MKFARYLEETQTPEWKKAYIDYRGLKKRITAIRRAQEASTPTSPRSNLFPLPLEQPSSSEPDVTDQEPSAEPHVHFTEDKSHETLPGAQDAANDTTADAERPPARPELRHSLSTSMQAGIGGIFPRLRRRSTLRKSNATAATDSAPATELFDAVDSEVDSPENTRRLTLEWDGRTSIPLMHLLPMLPPVHRAFFEKLDGELEKVETFFCQREKEAKERTAALKQQLQELQDHRRAYYEAHPTPASRRALLAVLPIRKHLPKPVVPTLQLHKSPSQSPPISGDASPNATLGGKLNIEVEAEPRHSEVTSEITRVNTALNEDDALSQIRSGEPTKDRRTASGSRRASLDNVQDTSPPRHDPEEYQHAKKKLKRAVLECYRGLEVLNNYRTLNLIGFRKALKKYEKVTRVPAQDAYTREKVETSAFASGASVESMLREMELLFAARFTRGDKKKATTRLRGSAQRQTHHLSTFFAGVLLGLAVPAFVSGIYQSFQPHTRAAIPGWDGLLFVYSIFFVPTLFSLLVGINILVWTKSRINYSFIFELDLRSSIDPHEYFEIPALLLATLCYAFWLSFQRIGSHSVAPSTWPLLWLAWAAIVMFDPFPLLFKSSRWWLFRNIGRLLTSGVRRVEFADFWMGDQFCSLVFTLSNLYFIVCTYSHGLDDTWRHCTGGTNWAISFVLASLPLLVRLVQSVKRWVDSRLTTHLINGGKYGSGIVYYLFYYLWRAHGGVRDGFFVLWCIAGVNYSMYAASWDLLMDWSLLRPHTRYPLLRAEVLYTDYIPLYYFAIVSNVLLRCIWMLYIPENGPDFVLRTFIAGILEMLRRWQWNFYRLENEHLGNVDQYRVTREVPLPYTINDAHDSDGGDVDEDERVSISSMSSRWRRRRSTHSKPSGENLQQTMT